MITIRHLLMRCADNLGKRKEKIMKMKYGEIYGAVIGDICGSYYDSCGRAFHERYVHSAHTGAKDTVGDGKTDKPETIALIPTDENRKGYRFTDDTICTAAISAAAQLGERQGREGEKYKDMLLLFASTYPSAGYGANFAKWLESDDPQPYNSWGNGSAMRVSPVGWCFNDEATVLEEAKLSAMPTHNHPEGIKGAQSVALAIFMLRSGASKEEVKERIEKEFDYSLSRTLAEIRPDYKWKVSCQESVPESFIAFLESRDFPSAIQNAISLGGDTDTMGAIAGSLAQAYYDEVTQDLHDLHQLAENRLFKRKTPSCPARTSMSDTGLIFSAALPYCRWRDVCRDRLSVGIGLMASAANTNPRIRTKVIQEIREIYMALPTDIASSLHDHSIHMTTYWMSAPVQMGDPYRGY